MHNLRMFSPVLAVAAATFGAVFHLIPAVLPFFAPRKWPMADRAGFMRECGFVVRHKYLVESLNRSVIADYQ